MHRLTAKPEQRKIFFERGELNHLLLMYGRKVSAGEWRDYAMDALPGRALFSVYRKTAEAPLYQIEKRPDDARKQGAFSVRAADGRVLAPRPRSRARARVLEPERVQLVSG